jgi:hypothetical protein
MKSPNAPTRFSTLMPQHANRELVAVSGPTGTTIAGAG